MRFWAAKIYRVKMSSGVTDWIKIKREMQFCIDKLALRQVFVPVFRIFAFTVILAILCKVGNPMIQKVEGPRFPRHESGRFFSPTHRLP